MKIEVIHETKFNPGDTVYQPRRKTPAFRRGDIRREVPVDTGAQMFYAEIS